MKTTCQTYDCTAAATHYLDAGGSIHRLGVAGGLAYGPYCREHAEKASWLEARPIPYRVLAPYLAAMVLFWGAFVFGRLTAPTPDWYAQANFACAEDEALIFVESQSGDRLGCVNLEEVQP